MDKWRVALKNDELDSFRQTLQSLRSRLRGDLSQMTDEALHWDNAGGSGNLSNVPLHMADLGTDNYDQEFTLGLIENEQGTLELVVEALGSHGKWHVRAMRGVRRGDFQAASAGDPLCPALYRLCTEAGGQRMKPEGNVGWCRQASAFLVDRPGRGGVRSGDQVDRLFETRPARGQAYSFGRTQRPRPAHQSQYGCLVGLRGHDCRTAA